MKSLKVSLLCAALAAAAGCSSMQTVHERAWTGGQFASARRGAMHAGPGAKVLPLPRDLPAQHKRGIVVVRVEENTPLALAGIQEGDVILSVNSAPLRDTRAFYASLDEAEPGAALVCEVYRDGEIGQREVVAGIERFRKERHVAFGIGISSRLELDFLPDPEFSLGALGFKRKFERLELHSPEARAALAAAPESASPEQTGLLSSEGWRTWIAVLSLGGNKRILSQQVVEPVQQFSMIPEH